jgi:hypothetical protein
MSKKKKKTTTIDAVTTEIVKLTYLQTLAISQSMTNTKAFETDSTISTSKSSKDKAGAEGIAAGASSGAAAGAVIYGPIGAAVGAAVGAVAALFDAVGLGKKIKTTTTNKSTGDLIKDQWLQPEFDVIRYSIGIRELTASSYVFAPKSELVSVAYVSPKEIIRAHILVDQYIPPAFDQNAQWIEYFLKVEGEDSWIKVNPLNSPTKFDASGDIIPKLISYNVPKPATAQVESKYQTTTDPVKGIRFKAVFTRPEGSEFQAMTPLLKSYRIIMSPVS